MKFKPIKHFLIIIVLIVTNTIISQSISNYITKQGGICFRTDDNQPLTKYTEYAMIFNSYKKNFTCAINLGNDLITQDYIAMLQDLQSQGHEIMDHTPWHRTNYFTTTLPTIFYQNHPGVYKIIGNKILLKHVDINLNYAQTYSKRHGYVNINNNIITSNSGEFTFFSKTDCYLYFPTINKLVFIDDWINNNTVKVDDLWRNSINLGNYNNIEFYNFDVKNIHLTCEAIKALAQESARLADYYNLTPLQTWIQPGGYFPQIYRNEIREACESELGYLAGGVFTDPSLKVFNEYDPNNDKKFGMNFGDFREDIWTLDECKEFIANGIAKHKVLMGHSHFAWGELLGGWEGLLGRTDSLIQWCIENQIPIRTYSEWADVLYIKTPDPYQNVFPKLNVDKDNNNYPDGYSKEINASEGRINFEGELINDDGVMEFDNHSFVINKVGNICYVGRNNWWEIDGLGGLEKGENDFSIYTKGAPGNFIEVDFKIGENHEVFKFPAENDIWTKYDIEQSINGNTSLIIPENISLIDISIKCSDYNLGLVKISGMSLKKKIILNELNLDLTIFLEGAYLGSNLMRGFAEAFPLSQPFDTDPWNYNNDETIHEVPNEEITDWVLVELRSNTDPVSSVARRAALLRSNGNIVDLDGQSKLAFYNVENGEYYIIIHHRNHLAVMSAQKVEIN